MVQEVVGTSSSRTPTANELESTRSMGKNNDKDETPILNSAAVLIVIGTEAPKPPILETVQKVRSRKGSVTRDMGNPKT